MVSDQAKGSLSITFEASLALATMKNMVGKIINMVTGGAKRQLSEKGFKFDMATPMVVSGKNHTIHHKAKGSVIIIPLRS